MAAGTARNPSNDPSARPEAWLNGRAQFQDGTLSAQVDAVELRVDAALPADLRLALDYWQEKRGDRLAPCRADIDPVDLAPILSRVMLVDVLHGDAAGAPDFRFRLAGTGVSQIYGAELTNRRPADMDPPAYGALIHRHYAEAVSRATPVAHRVMLDVESRRTSYHRIILPLSDDQATINLLLIVDRYADQIQDLQACFADAHSRAGTRQ